MEIYSKIGHKEERMEAENLKVFCYAVFPKPQFFLRNDLGNDSACIYITSPSPFRQILFWQVFPQYT